MQKQIEKKLLKKKSDNISDWYTDVILKAQLADYAPVKGCMVIRPYGYALWEAIQDFMNPLIKEKGVKNAYFPLFIPESFLNKEKEHVEGFSPHMAVVTYAGGEKLKENLVVRPTSETIMYEMYKKWTQSYRDFPILINQWCNIVRWEKRTYLFLRTSEFLWQEGHCAHITHEESQEVVLWALDMYKKTYQKLLSIYGIAGVKSEAEKFAGGDKTYTYEVLIPGGKALQGCTSHDLGQNFSKAFEWTILDNKGEETYPWQNSWGFSTRSIGALIMIHGDDQGVILPPQAADIQVIIVPIPGKEKAAAYSKKIYEKIKNEFRVEVDDRDGETAGFKFNKWEVKGVPVRIEIGDKEADSNTVTLARRDTGEKISVQMEQLNKILLDMLAQIQNDLLKRHQIFTEENTHKVNSYEEFKKIMVATRGFIYAHWCEDPKCEAVIKEETKASVRCLPLEAKEESGKCIYCGKPAKFRWLFAQSY